MSMHTNTPMLLVREPRGLTTRVVQFCRAQANSASEARISWQCYSEAGFAVRSRDPRLFALAQTDDVTPFNLSQVFSLSGMVLSTESVDAGWHVGLNGEAGQGLERWDGRGTHTSTDFDDVLRPLAIHEQGKDEPSRTRERFSYAGSDADAANHNLCGQLARHDDTAGAHWFEEYALTGAVIRQQQRFLASPSPSDWPLADLDRDKLLEAVDGQISLRCLTPLGEVLSQTDAQGNTQRFGNSVAGALKNVRLQLSGQAEQDLVTDIQYNAFGQVQSETAGNGVMTANTYDAVDGRLLRLTARKADNAALQDLSYEYDPVGNILRIEDFVQTTRYFRNQAIDPISTYVYDTLYQLIQANGREAIDATIGPFLPGFQTHASDPEQMANYTQRYDYDAGGNLQTLTHAGSQGYTRRQVTARYSNRSLPVVDGQACGEAELAAGFDANGNLRQLLQGQALTWDLRNQLQQVTTVVRTASEDDYECYFYDGSGQRQRKVRITLAANVTHRAEVRYLPGLEVRTDTATGENLHVISVSAGRNNVRVLHWVDGKPPGLSNDQLRYSLSDHLGSSTLELDDAANLISQESYYPFGGTSWWAGRNAIEAKYKTVRYSGQERDLSGLYYYGVRYYASWLFRWINPDPAGVAYGLNLYAMVGNQPISRFDSHGLQPVELNGKLRAVAKQTAIKLFSTEGVLSPFMREEVNNETQSWMHREIRKLTHGTTEKAYSAAVWGPKVWQYAAENFFPMQKMLAEDRAGMTPNEKQGMHIFWSTNAGARYINDTTRSFTSGSATAPLSIKTAGGNALAELSTNNGDSTVKLTHTRRSGMFDPAIKMLGKYEGQADSMARLFTASLGNVMSGELYRGGRVKHVEDFREGVVIRTSGFTAFTPDESIAKSFTNKFHDSEFIGSTSPVLFIVQGGAQEITSMTEEEGLFLPNINFTITSTRSADRHLNVFLKQGGAKPTHWI